ncbi:MAG TPA: outer membrane beta-barrel protein, partial [Phnomibacter sp.]|nr:outer membrane beta-barrel protein [Phnomibacter sp.]
AVVEDLLKRLPGVEVDKDGNIKANGQDVRRVLVDGKEFFGTDPKLATRNLQADMVNKVQVFERKSDQSQFTGFDDGNTEPTINLTLKEDKRNGVFGRVSGGAGTDGTYQANANVNKFQKGEQLSFIGQANNINQQGFSLMDALSFSGGGAGGAAGGRGGVGNLGTSGTSIAGFGGGQQQGITTTQAAGLNYNNFKNSKVDFTSSYFFNGTQLRNEYDTRRETFVADTFQIYNELGRSGRNNYNHRINMGIDWKLDSFNSIKITPSISYQTTESFSNTVFGTVGAKGTLLSDGYNNSTTNSEGYNLNLNALYRHKFRKAGRTFSTELRVGNNYSEADGTLENITQVFNGPGNGQPILRDQINTTEASAFNFGATMRYTEPMSRRSIMEFAVFHNSNTNDRDQRTFDFNPNTEAYDLPNVRLTNLIDNDYNTSGGGIKYRENRTGFNYTIGADLQRAELTSLVQGKDQPISQSFLNVLPNAQIQIGKNRYRNFRLFYNGNTQNPSVTQLQPIEDISSWPNVRRGNPNLKQSFTNNFRVNYNTFDPYTMKSFFLFGNIRQTGNAIVNSDSLFNNGGRLTTYENVSGVYSANLNGNMGFPLNFGDTRANINLGSGVAYNQNKEILSKEENTIRGLSITGRVSGTYMFKELFDVTLGGNVGWNKRTYTLNEAQNTNYLDYGADLDLNFYLPGGFTLGNTVAYNVNTGRGAGFDVNFTLWNAYLAKSLLKNKRAEARLTAFDILNQNIGNTRTATGNSIDDTRFLVLRQYFMLTFTYNLSKFGNIGGQRGGGPRMMMMGIPR